MPGDGRQLSDGEVVVRHQIKEGVRKFRKDNPGCKIHRALASCLIARCVQSEAQEKVIAVNTRSFKGECKTGGAAGGDVEL